MYVSERLRATQMNLTTTNNSVNLDSYNVNGEWKVLWTEAKRMEFPYASLPNEMFSNVAFTIKLRRRHLFYVINVTTSFFLRRHARDVMFSTSSTSSRLLRHLSVVNVIHVCYVSLLHYQCHRELNVICSTSSTSSCA